MPAKRKYGYSMRYVARRYLAHLPEIGVTFCRVKYFMRFDSFFGGDKGRQRNFCTARYTSVRGVGKRTRSRTYCSTAARLAAEVALLLPPLLGPLRSFSVIFLVRNRVDSTALRSKIHSSAWRRQTMTITGTTCCNPPVALPAGCGNHTDCYCRR